jgi:hypothetical protein
MIVISGVVEASKLFICTKHRSGKVHHYCLGNELINYTVSHSCFQHKLQVCIGWLNQKKKVSKKNSEAVRTLHMQTPGNDGARQVCQRSMSRQSLLHMRTIYQSSTTGNEGLFRHALEVSPTTSPMITFAIFGKL